MNADHLSEVDRAQARAMALPWTPRLLEQFEREQRSGAGLLAGGLAYRLFFWLVAFGLLVGWLHRGSRSFLV